MAFSIAFVPSCANVLILAASNSAIIYTSSLIILYNSFVILLIIVALVHAQSIITNEISGTHLITPTEGKSIIALHIVFNFLLSVSTFSAFLEIMLFKISNSFSIAFPINVLIELLIF